WVTSSSRSVLAAVSRSGASTSSRLAVAAGLLPWISMSSSVAGRSGLASSGCSLPGSSTSFAGAGGGATDLGGAAGSLPLASGSSLSLAARIFAISPAAEGNGALLVEVATGVWFCAGKADGTPAAGLVAGLILGLDRDLGG